MVFRICKLVNIFSIFISYYKKIIGKKNVINFNILLQLPNILPCL